MCFIGTWEGMRSFRRHPAVLLGLLILCGLKLGQTFRENLVIRDRAIHASLDAVKVKVELVSCVQCGVMFEPSKAQRNSQALDGGPEPAGPFCSRRCSGIYGASVQNGGDKLERQEIKKIYYREDK